MLLTLQAEGYYRSSRGLVIFVTNPETQPRENLKQYIGPVIVEGLVYTLEGEVSIIRKQYTVLAIESYCMPTSYKGNALGLLVKEQEPPYENHQPV